MTNPLHTLKKPQPRRAEQAELPDPFDEVRGG
jgi:hypothetical protein